MSRLGLKVSLKETLQPQAGLNLQPSRITPRDRSVSRLVRHDILTRFPKVAPKESSKEGALGQVCTKGFCKTLGNMRRSYSRGF